MEWTDRGIVLGTRRHGESGLIVEALTYAHGRHLGLVRGGRSSRHRATFQPGNSLQLTWRARLEDHLGVYSGDMSVARAAAVIESRTRLYGLGLAVALARLPAEREPAPQLASQLETLLDLIAEDGVWLPELVRFELAILGDLGFGLDLTECALTGVAEDLAWVSPKTGRAACRKAGAPYRDRLLVLPEFLQARPDHKDPAGGETVSDADILAGLRLTGHFLDTNVYGPRTIAPSETRAGLVRDLQRKK
ncbi:DNA recombination and repair protein RecO [hydrothermal vent metagenome]|uniref:DNA repair protein RecO n=1 Tax=hydrothermal vent metagenome TaxID=652676 RepID=A0A3B0TH11_9ZZZZ